MVPYQLATKAQAFAMKAKGATPDHIKRIADIKRRTLFKKARSRRKVKITREFDQRILKKVTTDQFGREKSCADIAAECGCSAQTL